MVARKPPARPGKRSNTVVVAEPLAPEGLDLLRRAGIRIVDAAGQSRSQLRRLLRSADALVVRSKVRVDDELLQAAPALKAVGRAGVGVDSIDVEAATRRGIVVINTPDASTLAAAEHAFALMFALCRHTSQAQRRVAGGEWSAKGLTGVELAGKTLGVIGLGRIGSAIATRARAFGMNVLAHDAYVSEARAESLGSKLVSLEELLREADIVTLHVPLTAQTEVLIGRDQIALMRPRARLINSARGGLVDETALLEALESGRLAGAALDVLKQEPPPKGSAAWRLLAHPSVVATPHLGGSTREAQARIAIDLCRDLLAALAGQPPSAAVNAPITAAAEARPFARLAYLFGKAYPQISGDAHIPPISLLLEGDLATHEPRPFVAAFLVGLLQSVTDQRVSPVNAEALARERGITIETLTAPCERGFTRALSMRAGPTVLAGTVLHTDQLRLVEVNGYEVELAPQGHFLMTRHRDVPGVVGKVGTVLGTAGVNISNLQVARGARGEAMMLLGVDRPPSGAVLTKLRAARNMRAVRVIEL